MNFPLIPLQKVLEIIPEQRTPVNSPWVGMGRGTPRSGAQASLSQLLLTLLMLPPLAVAWTAAMLLSQGAYQLVSQGPTLSQLPFKHCCLSLPPPKQHLLGSWTQFQCRVWVAAGEWGVGGGIPTPTSNLLTPALCPTIQLNPDIFCMEIASDSTVLQDCHCLQAAPCPTSFPLPLLHTHTFQMPVTSSGCYLSF